MKVGLSATRALTTLLTDLSAVALPILNFSQIDPQVHTDLWIVVEEEQYLNHDKADVHTDMNLELPFSR